MKKNFAAAFILLSAVTFASAQNLYLAEQQARRANQQNNAEQQRIADAAGGSRGGNASSAPSAAPADPALQATLANISSLQTDLAAFVNTPQPDAAQKNSLLNDFTQAAQSKKPSTDSAKELAKDLQTALAGNKNLNAAPQKQLAAFIHASFNGSHLTDAQSEKIFTSARKVLTDAGVSTDDAVNVVTDLKKIVSETK